MKKTIIFVMVLMMIVAVAGCFSKSNTVSEEDQQEIEIKEETVEEQSFMEDYIRSIDVDKRDSFLLYNESTKGFCQRLEAKLEEVGFEGEFEFNPSRNDEIPSELEAIYSFVPFTLFPGNYSFSDIKMTVKGSTVRLSYDGYEFYPTEYSYTDIKDMVDRVNAE